MEMPDKEVTEVGDKELRVAGTITVEFLRRADLTGGLYSLKEAKLDGSLDLDFAKLIQEGMGNGS